MLSLIIHILYQTMTFFQARKHIYVIFCMLRPHVSVLLKSTYFVLVP